MTRQESQAILNSSVVTDYRNEMCRLLQLSFPKLTRMDIATAVDSAILGDFHNPKVRLDNNYTHTTQEMYLMQLMQYISDKQPIFTATGCMFKRHGTVENPLYDLIQSFLDNRDKYKAEMKKYAKASSEFARYNLFQLLEKRSVNAIYGASGLYSSEFYNYYICNAITSQGRDAIASAIMQFEEFLSNNVKFGSLNEVVHFIRCVLDDPRTMRDCDVLDKNVTLEETFFKIISTCGFYYVPTEEDMQIVWDMLTQVSQEDLNRLFYRNNLYWFCENTRVIGLIRKILMKLDFVFIDPNKVPEIISDEMDELYALFKEYVYHPHIIIDATDRCRTMIRDVSILTDTDSSFVSLEGWYGYVYDRIKGIDMPLRHIVTDKETEKPKKELFPVKSTFNPYKEVFPNNMTFDFDTEDIIAKSEVINPNEMCSEAGLKFSITNIMSNILYRLQVEYMQLYCKQYYTWDNDMDRKCLIVLKNEFAIKNSLITTARKNYVSLQERQEEVIIPNKDGLDVKGLPITKSGVAERTKDQVKSILFHDVLNPESIDQVDIIKKLSMMEKMIYNSLYNGEKDYYKPMRIKALSSYESPTYAVISADAYNNIKMSTDEAIDLTDRNTICVINTVMNMPNIEKIKDVYPEVYNNAVRYMTMLAKAKNKNVNKVMVSYIGIPIKAEVPEWIKPFIDYTAIINDNMNKFPMKEVGIMRQGYKTLNTTNMINFAR